MQKTTIYRKPMGENLFEEEFTIEALSQMGNPLEQLAALVDFEMFRPALEDVLVKKECKTPAGRPQIDVVLMFKVIFLQRYYGLSDDRTVPLALMQNYSRGSDLVGPCRRRFGSWSPNPCFVSFSWKVSLFSLS